MVSGIVRFGLAVGTIAFAVIGTALGKDARWYAASGLLGTIWWLWDFLTEHVFEPMAASFSRMFFEGADLPAARKTNPLDTIMLLEKRLEQPVSEETDVQAALRLADLCRVMNDDPVRARAIVEMMKGRYPGNAALARYEEAQGG